MDERIQTGYGADGASYQPLTITAGAPAIVSAGPSLSEELESRRQRKRRKDAVGLVLLGAVLGLGLAFFMPVNGVHISDAVLGLPDKPPPTVEEWKAMKGPFPEGIQEYRVELLGVCLENYKVWGPYTETEGLPLIEWRAYYPLIGGVLGYIALRLIRRYKWEAWVWMMP